MKEKNEVFLIDTLEMIKTEYMLMDEGTVSKSLVEVCEFLDRHIDELKGVESLVQKEIRRNHIGYGIGVVENFLFGVFGGEADDLGYYDQDLGVIFSHKVLGERFGGFFELMRNKVTEDNFLEMAKLAQFTYDKYIDNYEYLESVRDSIGCASLGLNSCYNGENTQMAFEEFFGDEFAMIIAKGLEKKKKV